MASARAPEHDGVAIGRRLRHARGADHAAGAADVLDDDLLAQHLGQPLGDNAGEHIGAAAGRKAHHQRDGPVRPTALPENRAPHGSRAEKCRAKKPNSRRICNLHDNRATIALVGA